MSCLVSNMLRLTEPLREGTRLDSKDDSEEEVKLGETHNGRQRRDCIADSLY